MNPELNAMTAEWERNLEEMTEQYPELRIPESALRRRVAYLLRTHSVFHVNAAGIRLAVQMAALELQPRAEDYEAIAQQFADEGRPAFAAATRAKASELRQSGTAGALAEIIGFPKPGAQSDEAPEGHVPCPFHLNRWCLRCDG